MMPVSPATEPTDRSMPPVRITKVMPIATMPTTTDWSRRLKILDRRQEIGRGERQARGQDDSQHEHADFESCRPALREGAAGASRRCWVLGVMVSGPCGQIISEAARAYALRMFRRAGRRRGRGSVSPTQPMSWPRDPAPRQQHGRCAGRRPRRRSRRFAALQRASRNAASRRWVWRRRCAKPGSAAGARPTSASGRTGGRRRAGPRSRRRRSRRLRSSQETRVALHRGARRGQQRQLLLVEDGARHVGDRHAVADHHDAFGKCRAVRRNRRTRRAPRRPSPRRRAASR